MKAPTISRWLLRFFVSYSRRYVARHFHAVRVATSNASLKAGILPVLADGLPSCRSENGRQDARLPGQAGSQSSDAHDRPLVVYLNHCSWWDPLIAMLLADRCFPGRPSFAPMEARQLARYGIFRKLGVFGVEQGNARGARDFLRASEAVLTQRDAILWLTPQARFADVRERPLAFAAGLAGLVRRFPGAVFLPLAIEYAPWGERLPDALARFGEPESGKELRGRFRTTAELTHHFEGRLAQTMDELAGDAISRDAARFHTLVTGASGVSAFYDLWRRLRAFAGGDPFHAEHRPASPI